MRPGRPELLTLVHSWLPHDRLVSVDTRLAQAAARPVIIPETIGCDRGKVFLSDTFLSACQTLGISVQPARPRTPTDKGIVERTFASVNTLFTQHLAGYTGPGVARRGADVAGDAVWTLPELQDLLDEWIVACWQHRPHDGLRHPSSPRLALSPNEMYAALVAVAGYLPVTLSGEDYVELLPATWRAVNDYGLRIGYRTYDSPALGPFRRRPSGVAAKRGLWEIHHDPYDVTRVWLRHPDGGFLTVPWTHLPMVRASRLPVRCRCSRSACPRGRLTRHQFAAAVPRRSRPAPRTPRIHALQPPRAAAPLGDHPRTPRAPRPPQAGTAHTGTFDQPAKDQHRWVIMTRPQPIELRPGRSAAPAGISPTDARRLARLGLLLRGSPRSRRPKPIMIMVGGRADET